MQHRNIYRLCHVSLLATWMLMPLSAWADEAQMKETLTQMVDTLQAMKPLLQKAEREQPAHPRVTLHFDAWVDGTGKTHEGLRQDMARIEKAIIHTIQTVSVEPRVYPMLQADFIDKEVRK